MRKNVLLVLNSKRELETAKRKLAPDYKVYAARSGDDLQHLVNSVPVELIICSLDLPVGNVYKLCSQLKSSLQYAHLPIVLLIPENSLTSKIKSLEAGADAIIIRPFSWKYLKAQIKNLITNRLKITAHYTCSSSAVTTTSCNDVQERFLKKLNNCMVENNGAVNVNILARFLHMSRPTLYRRIKTVTGQTPNELINVSRLTWAAGLLASTDYKVFEIAARVGFSSQSSFGKAFIKHFGITPTEYQRRNRKASRQRGDVLQNSYILNVEKAIYSF